MARAIWNGTIGFGLVQIPVGLYAAEAPNELHLTLLDRRDFSPVGYERVNKTTGKEVAWEDIVKGYERGEGEYVVLTEHDFAEANVDKTRQMAIEGFVEFSEIDPRYIDRPYYLVPQKAGKKAYALLREALGRTGKAGVGKVVLRTRQHLAAVVAHQRCLVLVLLRFADELRDESALDLPDQNLKSLGVTPKEMAMAEQLIAGMTEPFQPEKFRDDYRHDLMKLIRRKAAAGEVNTVPESAPKKPRPKAGAEVIDLTALLAQSVKEKGKLKGPAKTKPKRGGAHQKAERERKSA